MGAKLDLKGQRFGRLTVLEEGKHTQSGIYWKCRCDCGTVKEVRGRELKKGLIKSCGCGLAWNKSDLKGHRFGRLVAIEECGRSKQGSVLWKCQCDCGNTSLARASALKSGHIQSCGCATKEAVTKHGMRRTRLYGIWSHMVDRCTNPNSTVADRYFDRGIKMCAEWRDSFEAFRDWALANGYSDKLSIDRINNNGNYEPSNCRWATVKEQGRNKRNNVMLTCNGETHCLAEWAEMTNQPRSRLNNRLRRGWSDTEIILGRI